MADRAATPAAAILTVLEEERAAILGGAFTEIARLSARKAPLLEGLAGAGLALSELQRIGTAVSRNQALLAAALDGMRSVTARMADLRRLRDGFETYGPGGARAHVGAPRPAFERKA